MVNVDCESNLLTIGGKMLSLVVDNEYYGDLAIGVVNFHSHSQIERVCHC